MAVYQELLGAKLSAKPRAVLGLALSFFRWRTLAGESGLKRVDTVDATVQAADCAK